MTVATRWGLGIAGLLAAAAAVAEPPPQRQQTLLHLLQHDCGSCHGMTLKGGLGPALLPANLAGKTNEFLVDTILEGRAATAMPPWRGMLSHEEAEWLIQQLRSGVDHAE
ncbi:MAG TPA: cytochrome c [Gammaproteobacteria bacterium]